MIILSFISSSWLFLIFLLWFSFFQIEPELKESIVQPKSCNFWSQNKKIYQEARHCPLSTVWKHAYLKGFFNTKIKQSFMSNGIISRSSSYPYLTFCEILSDYLKIFTGLFRPGLSLFLPSSQCWNCLHSSPSNTWFSFHSFKSLSLRTSAEGIPSLVMTKCLPYPFFLDGAWTIVTTSQITDSFPDHRMKSQNKKVLKSVYFSFVSTVITPSKSVSIRQKKKRAKNNILLWNSCTFFTRPIYNNIGFVVKKICLQILPRAHFFILQQPGVFFFSVI